MDAYTVRGIVFIAISSLGLGYEVFFNHPSRLFLLFMYSVVIAIGLFCIFLLKEKNIQ